MKLELKDFQKETVDRIVEIFKTEKQNRILLADEVGLGKTIIARGVVEQVEQWHKNDKADKHFKVVYICSNGNIANQNVKKLGITPSDKTSVSESRLSMQHLAVYKNEPKGDSYKVSIIPLTPATSFSMVGAQCGTQSERALMYVILSKLDIFLSISNSLQRFMKYKDGLKGWDGYVKDYDSQITELGIKYIDIMTLKLNLSIKNEEELSNNITELCRKNQFGGQENRECINRMRKIFAQISLEMLDPDLVIMDEFQRFKDLIAPKDDESGMLARKFLNNKNIKVLLLSATPYKPYSTFEEIKESDGEDHYQEFMQVMDFLLYESGENQKFKKVWKSYSCALSEIKSDTISVLIAHKCRAENELYRAITRTERFNSGIIDDTKAKEIKICNEDVLSYVEIQSLLKDLNIGNIYLDYVKSAPYLLSFMEYKIKEKIKNELTKLPNYDLLKGKDTLFINKTAIKAYKPLPQNNSRLQLLLDESLGKEESNYEKLLWIPATVPYYKTIGLYSKITDYSKILVFSSWEMVPRMVASMLSYESERRIYSKLNIIMEKQNKNKYSYFTNNDDEKRNVSSRLVKEIENLFVYPSNYLSNLYTPKDYFGKGIDEIRRLLKKAISERITIIRKDKKIQQKKSAFAKDYLELLRFLDGKSNLPPDRIPNDATVVLADMAIAAPAVCALRIFKDEALAERLANCFKSLFDKKESIAIIDLIYGDSPERFYKNVFSYCVEGNLQSVLNEFVYMLNEDKAESLCSMMESAFAVTTSLKVETLDSFRKGNTDKKMKMRTHFTVGYFNAKSDEKNEERTENIRNAFNSPFRPFVLATTSIGQEGLDFHLYCRKIMHWNLPSNPVDFEQREGRINRYQCYAIRKTIANKYKQYFDWDKMFEAASKAEKGDNSDLVPFWCFPPTEDKKRVKIERIVPMYPFSADKLKYERLIDVLSLYRLTLGQPRQEDLIKQFEENDINVNANSELFIDLSPFSRNHKHILKV